MTEGAVNLTRKDELSLDAAHLYYGGMTQAEVAGRLHVSRPTVSKLLAHAERRGFVHIEVLDPREHDEHLIASLQERYALDELRLVPRRGIWRPCSARRRPSCSVPWSATATGSPSRTRRS